MTTYVVARLLAIIPTALMLLLVVVVMVRLLPGDAVDVLVAQASTTGGAVGTSKPDRDAIEHRLGLDQSLPEQYGRYTLNALQGDLGQSFWGRESVVEIIGRALPVTLMLSAMALLWGTAVGVLIGIISAARRGGLIDYVLRSISILGLSVPNFALATLLVVLPTIWWKWSPPLLYTGFSNDNVWAYFSQFLTPAFVLGLGLSATIMRLSRTQLLEVLRQDYVRTARAKGLNERVTLFRHALPNAMIPVVSHLGVQIGTLISGTVIIEAIFGLPGIGRLLLSAVAERNYPVLQGIAVVTGLFVICINLAVDAAYGLLNPRVRLGG